MTAKIRNEINDPRDQQEEGEGMKKRETKTEYMWKEEKKTPKSVSAIEERMKTPEIGIAENIRQSLLCKRDER